MERRYVIVTSQRRGIASLFVDLACRTDQPTSRPLAVLLCAGVRPPVSRASQLRRRLRKVRRIGVLGALNGLRMRRWYGSDVTEALAIRDLDDVCSSAAVPRVEISGFWEPAAQKALADLKPDVAISLGNGFIPREFFEIPRFGMWNVHHELLPQYRGAQTAIWQIYDGSTETGFSIHEITTRIDGGRILLRETLPISFHASLRQTVVSTAAMVQRRSMERLLDVVMRADQYRDGALANDGTKLYTTPSGRAMLRIYRNHAKLRGVAL